MYPGIEPFLYVDVQAAIPALRCSRCGGARYQPGYACLRCERRAP